MSLRPVEWVLVVFYGRSAHRANYGRQVGGTRYTKDYIQLSRKREFLDAVQKVFPFDVLGNGVVPLSYEWPTGSTRGALVFQSADRPHLKWETALGAPQAWKMSLTPSDDTAETIPGDPAHTDFAAAENELALLGQRGAGQPYLVAVKLRDEPDSLHLRAYLHGADSRYSWASIQHAPPEVQELASRTSADSALAWSLFQSGGEAPSAEVEYGLHALESPSDTLEIIRSLGSERGGLVASYLSRPGYGLFFDPTKNHDAWAVPAPLRGDIARSAAELVSLLRDHYPQQITSDVAAEVAETDPREIEVLKKRAERADFSVPDATSTLKTRGSAQRVFADLVKANYAYRCAVTGISTREFLVASHIVPWSEDSSIRLDPANGICLSLMVDRAFEKGHLVITDDLMVRVNAERIGDDLALLDLLTPYDGKSLARPHADPPRTDYLQRRRALIDADDDRP